MKSKSTDNPEDLPTPVVIQESTSSSSQDIVPLPNMPEPSAPPEFPTPSCPPYYPQTSHEEIRDDESCWPENEPVQEDDLEEVPLELPATTNRYDPDHRSRDQDQPGQCSTHNVNHATSTGEYVYSSSSSSKSKTANVTDTSLTNVLFESNEPETEPPMDHDNMKLSHNYHTDLITGEIFKLGDPELDKQKGDQRYK